MNQEKINVLECMLYRGPEGCTAVGDFIPIPEEEASCVDIYNSVFADMLNDDERNRAFNEAILYSVEYLVRRAEPGQILRCVDIGAGTGLLSMMVARAFKQLNFTNFLIIAFEKYQPMFETALLTIEKNNLSDHIMLIGGDIQSYELVEMNYRADLIVAELLDTELIGEGCLYIYQHAAKFFAKPNCIYIPSKADIYLEPVSSQYLYSRNFVDSVKTGRGNIKIKLKCHGAYQQLDDLHLDALEDNIDVQHITNPVHTWHMNFTKKKFPKYAYAVKDFFVNEKPKYPVVICSWWVVTMYDKQLAIEDPKYCMNRNPELALDTLSNAPRWAKTKSVLRRDAAIERIYRRQVWREHWLQSVYYLENIEDSITLQQLDVGGKIRIVCQRDDFSFIYGALFDKIYQLRPVSQDVLLNRSRVALCHTDYFEKIFRNLMLFLDSISENNQRIHVYCYSQDLLYVLARFATLHDKVASVSWKTRYPTQPDGLDIVDGATDKSIFRDRKELIYKVSKNDEEKLESDCFIFDCYSQLYLTKNIESWWNVAKRQYILRNLKNTFPARCIFKCAFVKFTNLNRICNMPSQVEGFDLTDLFSMVENARLNAKETIGTGDVTNIEYHHLWEYETQRLSADVELFNFDFESVQGRMHKRDIEEFYEVKLTDVIKEANGDLSLAIWVEYQLLHDTTDPESIIYTGPLDNNQVIGSYISWNRSFIQGVHFLPDLLKNKSILRNRSSIIITAKYDIIENHRELFVYCDLN